MATIRRVQPIVLPPGTVVLSVDEVNRVVQEVNAALDGVRTTFDELASTPQPPAVPMLNDATGGTAGPTLGSPTDEVVRNGFASIARAFNSLLIALRGQQIIR